MDCSDPLNPPAAFRIVTHCEIRLGCVTVMIHAGTLFCSNGLRDGLNGPEDDRVAHGVRSALRVPVRVGRDGVRETPISLRRYGQ